MSNEPQYPCSNGFCWLRAEPLVGQHTNGPCNCLRDIPLPLQLEIKRKLTHQREEILSLTDIQRRDSERIERLAGEVARLASSLDAVTRDRITAEREVERLTEELAATTRRIDSSGRDVTDLPGLWDEEDRVFTAVEFGEEVGRLMAERDRLAYQNCIYREYVVAVANAMTDLWCAGRNVDGTHPHVAAQKCLKIVDAVD